MPWGIIASAIKKVGSVAADAIDGGGFAWGSGGGRTAGVRGFLGEQIQQQATTGLVTQPRIQPAGLFSPPPQWGGAMPPPVYNRGAMAAGVVPGLTAAARAALRLAIVQARNLGVPRSGVKAWLRSNATVSQILTITGIGVVVDLLIDEIYGPGSNGAISSDLVPMEIMVEPVSQERRTCPRGFVLVTLHNGEAVCMLREYAVKHKFYKPRRKPPITASDMRILRRGRTTAAKLCRIAGAAVELEKVVKPRRRRRKTC